MLSPPPRQRQIMITVERQRISNFRCRSPLIAQPRWKFVQIRPERRLGNPFAGINNRFLLVMLSFTFLVSLSSDRLVFALTKRGIICFSNCYSLSALQSTPGGPWSSTCRRATWWRRSPRQRCRVRTAAPPGIPGALSRPLAVVALPGAVSYDAHASCWHSLICAKLWQSL